MQHRCFAYRENDTVAGRGVGVHLYLKLDILLVKNHIIRAIFLDQLMYELTSFRVQNHGKMGVLLVMFTNFGKDMIMIKKLRENMQKLIFRVYFFIPGKYVLWVYFESPFYEEDIHPDIQVPPGWLPSFN